MTTNVTRLDSLLKKADPLISSTLDRALSEKEISAKEAELLFYADGVDFHLVGMVADELRRRRVGNIVTYVVNRNINFTNVCVKQCTFCAFSRSYRDEEAYFLPIEEIVRRVREAAEWGATEVCIQAALPPKMADNLYVEITRAVKKAAPEVHLHA